MTIVTPLAPALSEDTAPPEDTALANDIALADDRVVGRLIGLVFAAAVVAFLVGLFLL